MSEKMGVPSDEHHGTSSTVATAPPDLPTTQSYPPYPSLENDTQQQTRGAVAAPQPGFIAQQDPAPDPTSGASNNPAPYPEPPPSYQSAMTYPSAAPYGPTVNSSFPPKPIANQGYPPVSNQNYPQGVYPQPPNYYPQPVAVTQPVTSSIMVHVTNGVRCPHCNIGVLQKETDLCCTVSLVLLTIFTFPLGLIFLCCLPCAFTRKCSNCRRVG